MLIYASMILPKNRDPRNLANKYRKDINEFIELLCFSEATYLAIYVEWMKKGNQRTSDYKNFCIILMC
jgi:hypothetical protein